VEVKATNGPPRRKLSVTEIVATISISLTVAGLWLARERALWNFADAVNRLDSSVTKMDERLVDSANRVSVMSFRVESLQTGLSNMGSDDKAQWEAIRKLHEDLIEQQWKTRREPAWKPGDEQGNP
jgi:hypothetical protein